MKKYLFIFFSFFYLSSYAQYTDGVVADLINKRDFFNLESQIDSLSKNIYYEHLKYIAKGLVDFYANKPEESNIYFDKLFSEHKNEIDAQSLYMFELIRGVNYMRLKQYDLAYNLFSQIEKTPNSDFYLKICSVKKEYPDSTVWNSDPITLYKDSTGLSVIQIKDLYDSIHPFIFDTGANYSCIPESDCSKFEIKILMDSFNYFGYYNLKVGIAPKLKIGEIVAYNMLFLIWPDSISKFPKTNINLRVIGWDFMYRADNIQLTNSAIIFNQKLINQQLNNLLIDFDKPLVNLEIGASDVTFLLDTGNQCSFINTSEESSLSSFDYHDKLDSIGVGGAFGIKVEKYKLFNNVSISSGNTKKISNLMMRYPSEGMQNAPEQSLLGQDILQLFTKRIIDIKNNTFILE